MYIAVSGNLGSGKTTLAKGLARQFGCPAYPTTPYDETYINHLFSSPNRWAFEAQTSFLIHKYNEITKGLNRERLFVLERTISEDIEVFAKKFFDDGVIDARSMDLLQRIYDDLMPTLPSPSLILWCDCPDKICEERLASRPRQYQDRYPSDHITKLSRRLAAWIQSVKDVPVLKIDTTGVDYRTGNAIRRLAFEVDAFVRKRETYFQPDLFSGIHDQTIAQDAGKSLFEVVNSPSHLHDRFPATLIRQKTVYLAAPFSTKARRTILSNANDPRLFAKNEHVDLLTTYYRETLSNLCRAIESHGYRVFLPHRDINGWGQRTQSAADIARKCIEEVAKADYFVGIIAESFGSHLELGVALGMGKPSVVLVPTRVPLSFFGTGVASSGRVRVIEGRTIKDIVQTCRADDFLSRM
jgi:hypothetical protein